jgi:hypothetical protein
MKVILNRQDARNARVWDSKKSPFLATLAPWRSISFCYWFPLRALHA